MGTGAMVRVFLVEKSGARVEYCAIFQQSEGYPESLGAKLVAFAETKRLTSGLTGDDRDANGAGCFAAQLVMHLKGKYGRAGGVYLYPPGFNAGHYEYHVLCPEQGSDDPCPGPCPVVVGYRQGPGHGHAGRTNLRRLLDPTTGAEVGETCGDAGAS